MQNEEQGAKSEKSINELEIVSSWKMTGREPKESVQTALSEAGRASSASTLPTPWDMFFSETATLQSEVVLENMPYGNESSIL